MAGLGLHGKPRGRMMNRMVPRGGAFGLNQPPQWAGRRAQNHHRSPASQGRTGPATDEADDTHGGLYTVTPLTSTQAGEKKDFYCFI